MLPFKLSSKIFDLPKTNAKIQLFSQKQASPSFSKSGLVTKFQLKTICLSTAINVQYQQRFFASKKPKEQKKSAPIKVNPSFDYNEAEGLYLEGIAEMEKEEQADEKKIFELFDKAQQLGHLPSRVQYAKGLITGSGCEANPKKGFEILKQLADKDHNAEAMLAVGVCYREGEGVETNNEMGIKYMTMAAEKKHPEALTNLGVLYMNGDGVASDQVKAVEYFSKAAALNSEKAQFNLAMCYEHGLGVERDERKAFELFYPLAEKGEPLSASTIGFYFMQGLGTQPDEKQALKFLKKGAAANLPDALCNLGICYLTGFGVEIDPKQAAKHFKRASDLEYPEGDYNLGQMYLTGDGIERNPSKAMELLSRASSRGFSDATFALGNCWELGIGVEKDLTKAREFFEVAKSQSHADASAKLAEFYLEGIGGLNKDPEQAFKLHQEAYAMGSLLGAFGSFLSLAQGVGTPKNVEKAHEALRDLMEGNGFESFPEMEKHPVVQKHLPLLKLNR